MLGPPKLSRLVSMKGEEGQALKKAVEPSPKLLRGEQRRPSPVSALALGYEAPHEGEAGSAISDLEFLSEHFYSGKPLLFSTQHGPGNHVGGMP